MSALVVKDLSKSFGGVHALRGVSFTVEPGELLAMIGPNGAGKSTCFNAIAGVLAPDSGKIFFENKEIKNKKPYQLCALGIGRTFQVAATFGSMTVRENVAVVSSGSAVELLQQLGLQDQADRPCAELAYGDLKRVELAIALAARPRLLLMDEPTAGMATDERHALMDLVKSISAEQGLSVLFTEHDMDAVFTYADRVIVLSDGELIASGTPAVVRADPLVRRVYLGRRPMLELRHVNAGYGRAQVLFDVDLRLGAGEVVALLGRNGAGKSTLLKTVMGLLRVFSGSVQFEDQSIQNLEPYEIARLGLGYVPEDRRIFTDLTVMENLEAGRQAPRAGLPAWTPEKLFALFPNLGRMRDRRGGSMSGGEQQMLAIARTLMGNPSAILLDEPFEGLAPVIVEGVAASIRELKRAGLSVLLCEQNQRFARLVAERACLIERGGIRPCTM